MQNLCSVSAPCPKPVQIFGTTCADHLSAEGVGHCTAETADQQFKPSKPLNTLTTYKVKRAHLNTSPHGTAMPTPRRHRRKQDNLLTRIFQRLAMIFQCALIGGTAALTLAPPTHGAMLVAPLLPGSSASTLDWALPTGARLLAPGPYAGSFVVYGTRSTLLASAIKHGTLLLTARYSGCGSDTRKVA